MNSTNITDLTHLIRQRRHKSFVGEVSLFEKCNVPTSYEDDAYDLCDFVTQAISCSKPVVFINYLKFMVCALKLSTTDRGLVVAACIFLFAISLYFTMLYVITKYFLLPNFIMLLQAVNIKAYDFTLIVLSTVSQLPKIASHVLTCYHFSTSYALLNANRICRIFNSIIFSVILIGIHSKGLEIQGLYLLRDIIIVALGTGIWHGTLVHDMYNTNTLGDTQTGPIVIYMAYISFAIYVVYMFSIVFCWKRKSTEEETSSVPQSSASLHSDDYPHAITYAKDHNVSTWKQFLETLNPFLYIHNRGYACKIFMSPFFVMWALFLPVVRKERHLLGWCKIVFALSFASFPVFFSLTDLSSSYLVGIILASLLGSILALFLTHAKRLPKFHKWISLWGLIVGSMAINTIDSEVNVIFWQMLHYVLNWSDDITVLTTFSIGSVFVESIFVVHFSKLGRSDMAFGYIMGTSIVLSYGSIILLPASLCFLENQYFVITATTTTTFMFFYLSLFFLLFSVAASDFTFRRSHSVFFLMVCILYYILLMLFQYDLLHPYATIHHLEVYPDVIHAFWA